MHTIYLGLGSNLGDRAANLRAAVKALGPEVKVLQESALYETPPWGVEDQPGFLNMALKAETNLTPEALRDHVKRIEAEVGRTPTYHWGPRLIDIDILLYDDRIVDTPDLVIPHPQMHKRPVRACSAREHRAGCTSSASGLHHARAASARGYHRHHSRRRLMQFGG